MVGERRGQERRVWGREGKGGERRQERGMRGKERRKKEGDAHLTQIPGSVPGNTFLDQIW